jgi:hypothetical protein
MTFGLLFPEIKLTASAVLSHFDTSGPRSLQANTPKLFELVLIGRFGLAPPKFHYLIRSNFNRIG